MIQKVHQKNGCPEDAGRGKSSCSVLSCKQKNTEELINFYEKRGHTTNFHENFADLNPDYFRKHDEKVKKVANNWMDRLG